MHLGEIESTRAHTFLSESCVEEVRGCMGMDGIELTQDMSSHCVLLNTVMNLYVPRSRPTTVSFSRRILLHGIVGVAYCGQVLVILVVRIN
jgi:hypothetical protein